MKRSKKSGRASPVVQVDQGRLSALVTELNTVRNIIEEKCGETVRDEVNFAILWAFNWYLTYEAGQCSLLELLVAARNGFARVPPPWHRALLGVIAHKATFAIPARIGEHKARTVPFLVRSVGSLVQSFLFDDEGKQLSTIEHAANQARTFLQERNLIDPVPPIETVVDWWREWRQQEQDAGIAVPVPRRGRPRKSPLKVIPSPDS